MHIGGPRPSLTGQKATSKSNSVRAAAGGVAGFCSASGQLSISLICFPVRVLCLCGQYSDGHLGLPLGWLAADPGQPISHLLHRWRATRCSAPLFAPVTCACTAILSLSRGTTSSWFPLQCKICIFSLISSRARHIIITLDCHITAFALAKTTVSIAYNNHTWHCTTICMSISIFSLL